MSKLTHISFHYFAVALAWVLLVFSSCEQKLDLGFKANPSRVVLLGELTAGDTVRLRAGQSAPYSPDTIIFKLVENLNLTLTDPAGVTHPMQMWDDFNSQFWMTWLFGNTLQVQAGSTYTLRSQHPTLDSAICQVSIPKPFTTSIVDTATKTHASVEVMQFDIEIQDDATAENFYMAEVFKQPMWIHGTFLHDGFWHDIEFEKALYDSLKQIGPVQTDFDTTIDYGMLTRLSTYTTDDLTENVKFGTSSSAYGRILISDHAFNGSNYTLKIMTDKHYFDSEMMRGRVLIKVKSIAKEYFDYLKVAERSTVADVLTGSGIPMKLEGNVKRGLGVVGGVYLREFYYYFDDWGF